MLEICLTSHQMDILEHFGSLEIPKVIIDTVRTHAHLDHLEEGLDQRMLAPVERDGIKGHCALAKLHFNYLATTSVRLSLRLV
jgi:hypothetical protein